MVGTTNKSIDAMPSGWLERRTAPPTLIGGAGGVSNRHLQILGRPERNLLACLYLNCFASSRIAPYPGSPLPNLQNPQTCNTDPFALLGMLRDQADEIT